jgi:hypothetical protein
VRMGRGAIGILAAAFLLAGCGAPRSAGTGSGTGQNPGPSITVVVSPSSSPGAAPTPTPEVSPAPSPSPAASPSPSEAPLTCFPITGGPATVRGTIADVRVGSHPGYDRLVIELAGGVTRYSLDAHDIGDFVHSFRGDHVDVAGNAGILLHLYNQDIPPVFAHGTDLLLDSSQLREVVVLGDFEGTAEIAIGLNRLQCPTVSSLDSPPRLVIDFPTG